MAAKAVLKMSRSLRSGRELTGGKKNKRYNLEEIKNLTDLRTFFYEYSIFVGDVASLPGVPSLQVVNKTRNAFLKAGRIMGDAKAVGNTLKKLQDGVDLSDFEGAGERAFRRFGGRTTGKVLMAIPGSDVFSRAARSVVGANMQKEFDQLTKSLFRSSGINPGPVTKAYGKLDFKNLSHNKKVQKVVEMVTEDIERQAYNFTPVKTGKLRGSLRSELKYEPVRGGSIPVGRTSIGGEGIDYALKIEYGEGPGFNVGAGYTRRYFPEIPTAAQALRSSKNNRRAVNKASGKGAMMRRGATLAIQRLRSSGLAQVLTDTRRSDDIKKVISDALNVRLG